MIFEGGNGRRVWARRGMNISSTGVCDTRYANNRTRIGLLLIHFWRIFILFFAVLCFFYSSDHIEFNLLLTVSSERIQRTYIRNGLLVDIKQLGRIGIHLERSIEVSCSGQILRRTWLLPPYSKIRKDKKVPWLISCSPLLISDKKNCSRSSGRIGNSNSLISSHIFR